MKPKNIPRPSFFADAQFTGTIRKFAAEAESFGYLHPQQISIIYKEGWFNLFVPKEYGGLELSLPEGLRIEESLAWIDGSMGWTVTLCGGANWFIGFLAPETAEMIFDSQKVCLAGSGRANGIAKMINDGYEISGDWPYATGAAHATAFTANCIIEKDGIPLQNEDGSQAIAAFIFLKNEVSIREDWKAMGMKATSSNSFSVNKVFVTKARKFNIDEKQAILPGKIYQYPFLQFAESTLAVNVSGMAIHFLDLFEAIRKERKSNDHFINEQLLACSLQLNEARQAFYQTIERSWNAGNGSNQFSQDTLTEVSKISRLLANTSLKMVDNMFPFCGLIAADPGSEINRVWRNIHTACLHPLLLLS